MLYILLFMLVALAGGRSSSDKQYEVLTQDGAMCAPGAEITTEEDCQAAVDAANAAIGKPGIGVVDTVEYEIRPKGCYTIAYSESYGYSLGYLNIHETGSGKGTDVGDNRYLYCHVLNERVHA